MKNLKTIELKAFIPAKDYALSKQFYGDLGFTMASDTNGIAYFHFESCSFLLQDFYQQELAENLMMHLLVADANAWHQHLTDIGLAEKYGIKLSKVSAQPWGMLDFVLVDPSGVLWRFGQNI
ncbi:hypothetical protein Q7C_979 [Methylophaga frappieri]|uniref:Glyoxalase/fosfomycin resistance/dioxygenase domain-containing protein n=1 Tax=Methylophaga frappieri (strain ATCC BAA-2434 / DSM 25690 / JAM7) TaxID=754477 RepID=I1YGV5_METFJ|nr:VOC family protein [Methylophaga frappieri]AFJ02148.1 hypothetical protein Q7C_979 [Methylophaga frappieri]